MTTVSTHNRVRADVVRPDGDATPARRASRAWALAGVGAALAGMATIVTSSMVDPVYREEFAPDITGISDALADRTPVLFAFHSITMAGAVLMLVFAAGLLRRLRPAMPDSLVPTLAFAGLAGTAVVSVLGAGLDTEFMVPFSGGEAVIDDASAAVYNHWIGTIPWLWVLVGLSGLALFVASRRAVVPRWIGRTGLVLGGITLLAGVSPLEYMAGPAGALWLLGTSLGFLLGDRAHRASVTG